MSIQLFYPENLLTYGELSKKPQIDIFKKYDRHYFGNSLMWVVYDEGTAERLRDIFEGIPFSSEKKMFGSLGFVVQIGRASCRERV